MQRLAPYFSFRGRATRLSYWRVQLAGTVISGLLVLIAMPLILSLGQVGGVVMLGLLPLLAAMAATGVRRLHDRNRTGWWLVAYTFVPGMLSAWVETQNQPAGGVSILAALVSLFSIALWGWAIADLGFLRGTPGPNPFGPDPTAPTAEEVFG